MIHGNGIEARYRSAGTWRDGAYGIADLITQLKLRCADGENSGSQVQRPMERLVGHRCILFQQLNLR